MSTCEEIGARIKQLREQEQMTQAQLAEKMNTSREAINLWERGARDMKTGTICALAKIFNVSCDYLLTGTSAENITLAKDLGLTNNAIEILRLLNSEIQYPYRRIELESFNFIIEHCNSVTRSIYEYLTTDFRHSYTLRTKPSSVLKDNGKILVTLKHDEFSEKCLVFKQSAQNADLTYLTIDSDIFDQACLSNIATELRIKKQSLLEEGAIKFDDSNN